VDCNGRRNRIAHVFELVSDLELFCAELSRVGI